MTRQDEIAAKAVRSSTLKSLKMKKQLRLQQLKDEYTAKVREVNIQYAEDPERLRAKYAADDYAKSEKAKMKAAKAIDKEKKLLEREKKQRPYTLAEEIFSAIVQGLGAALFIAATVLLDEIALKKVPGEAYFKNVYFMLYTSFGISYVLNYVLSVLHHALTATSAKEVFRRLCRCMTYIIIACAFSTYTYTAVTAGAVASLYGTILICVILAICLVGIFICAIGGVKFEVVNIVFFAILGWSGLFIFAQLYHVISKTSFGMLITSGIFYTLGLVFSSIRKVKFMHAIGNLIILSASVYMFFSFFFMF